MDLSKAFDTVAHSILLEKMTAYGINGMELEWFTSYLFQRKQQVVLNNVRSETHYVKCGVPQGSILGPLLFFIFFNDFSEILTNAKTIQYADDTVIYYSSKTSTLIRDTLNIELQSVERYLIENDLIINLKKGKTETMLIGTSQKLKKSENFNLSYNNIDINNTHSYTYLGCTVDYKLLLNENFQKSYKKTSNRLRLLSALRRHMDSHTSTAIYNAMIIPLMSFNNIIDLNFNDTQRKKFTSLHKRAQIVTGNNNINKIHDVVMRNACNIVRKCVENRLCEIFNGYFEKIEHSVRTRNSDCLLKLPKVKLDVAKNGFYFMGAKVYNSLPISIRKEGNYSKFKLLLKNHCF